MSIEAITVFEKEMGKYAEAMKTYLPIEKRIKKLKRSGKRLEEIKTIIGSDSYILEYVPDTLYHGSPQSLYVINPNESTQKGRFVYATDNPVHALFFSVFRNSSIARAHIDEYIDENGEYKVKYIIDERVKGALDEIIKDIDITIHVCKGEQFFKPQGEAYISREWISKEGQSIVPTDRIQINIKEFFAYLEKQGLVEYVRYDKTKDWKTVLDMLGQNYPFGLGTNRGKNIEEFDGIYDEFIEKYFPEQLEFSKKFRLFVKRIMNKNYRLQYPNMSEEEELDYKLRFIREVAEGFMVAQKDEKGNIKWFADTDKIKDCLAENYTRSEEITVVNQQK